MTLEEFSAGYYVGRFYVEPSDREHAVIARDQHEAANEQVYATGKDIDRLDHPLVMKVDETHLPVFAADDVPIDTLGLPDSALESTRVAQPPTLKDVLVAKAARAAQLLQWATPYTIREPNLA
ncbi:DUF5802 family protein [Haloarcula nitratireducens]|uniref:Uncharacterized protein n=1 Tax=Haloarcula nitratireducens TaxID=2487749 RepID=A0AAW4PH50_9EURY|nr:DUF5802 family protein [Halomicroarcula nitratireducens]MBX0297256.1 hypothetical protein [Halomicroarcula nitratireducens]